MCYFGVPQIAVSMRSQLIGGGRVQSFVLDDVIGKEFGMVI